MPRVCPRGFLEFGVRYLWALRNSIVEPERAERDEAVKLRKVERRCQIKQSATASVDAVAPLQYIIPMFVQPCQLSF